MGTKKMFLLVVGIIPFIILLVFLFNFLRTGRIIIETNDPSSLITLSKIGSGEVVTEVRGGLDEKLATGTYLATVGGGSFSTSQNVEVKAFKTQRYRIDTKNATPVEPVLDSGGTNLAADNSKLLYLDSESSRLFQLSRNNSIRYLDIGYKFEVLEWADTSFGVAQDSEGRLYTVEGGQIKLLQVPFSHNDPGFVSFSVDRDRKIYVSKGSDVYRGSLAEGFEKIYTSEADFVSLRGKNGKTIVLEAPGVEAHESSTPSVTLVDEPGEVTRSDFLAYDAKWSPDGGYIALSGESENLLLDSSLGKVAVLPSEKLSSLAWLDENTLLYGEADQLWAYDLASQKSTVIANMPLGGLIRELALSDNKKYVYIVVGGIGGEVLIKRVGLDNQKVPERVLTMQSIFPYSVGYCELSLVNFTTVGILSSPNSAECRSRASKDLASRGFKPSQFQFVAPIHAD